MKCLQLQSVYIPVEFLVSGYTGKKHWSWTSWAELQSYLSGLKYCRLSLVFIVHLILKKNGKMLLETRCEFYGFFLKHNRRNTNNCWHLLDEIRETAGYFWTFSLEINIQTWEGPQISLPQNCVLCPFPMILRCSVPSPRLWGGPDVPEDSRRFLTVTVNSESGSGLAGGFCLLSEAPLTFNLPSKLTHWPLLLMQSAAQQHQRQCQTHPLYLLWARCGPREVNFHQQTAAFGGINPHLLLFFRHKWFEIHDSSRNVKYGDLCSSVFFLR